MKPRLRLKGGVWSCAALIDGYWVIGFDYSPYGAWADYQDWARRCEKWA